MGPQWDLWFRVKWTMGDLTWEHATNVDELSALDDYLTLHGVANVEELPKVPIEISKTESHKGIK